MKNVLFGLTVGVVLGYALRRMEDQGQFDSLGNKIGEFADKAKRKVKDMVDTGKNQAEYVKDRVENFAESKMADHKMGDKSMGENKSYGDKSYNDKSYADKPKTV